MLGEPQARTAMPSGISPVPSCGVSHRRSWGCLRRPKRTTSAIPDS